MPPLHVAGTSLEWDPHTRIIAARVLDAGAKMSGEDARLVLHEIDRLAGEGAVGILIDARRAEGTTLGWRLEWTGYFRARPKARMAVHDLPPSIRILFDAFAHAIGPRARAFGSCAEARGWLEAWPPVERQAVVPR